MASHQNSISVASLPTVPSGTPHPMSSCLQVLTDVFGMVEARTQLIMPSLLPALASNLGSSNQQIRSTATTAMDALVAVVPPGHLLQSLSHIVMHSSSVKSKVILVEKLGGLLPQVRSHGGLAVC